MVEFERRSSYGSDFYKVLRFTPEDASKWHVQKNTFSLRPFVKFFSSLPRPFSFGLLNFRLKCTNRIFFLSITEEAHYFTCISLISNEEFIFRYIELSLQTREIRESEIPSSETVNADDKYYENFKKIFYKHIQDVQKFFEHPNQNEFKLWKDQGVKLDSTGIQSLEIQLNNIKDNYLKLFKEKYGQLEARLLNARAQGKERYEEAKKELNASLRQIFAELQHKIIHLRSHYIEILKQERNDDPDDE